ncbi:MAG: dihydrolipoamide acetyltransferase family protein [Terracidiphilus sp.]
MAVPVEVPKLGNTVEECLISKWLRQKGESVSAGQAVVEIETDKTSFEVAAPVDGVLLETFFEAGALVPVFTSLFVIGKAGEDVEEFRPKSGAPVAGSGTAEAEAAAQPAAEAGTPAASGPVSSSPAAASAPLSPRARRFAAEHNIQPGAVQGSGPGGRVLEQDVRAAYHSAPKVSALAGKSIQGGMGIAGHGSGIGGMILSSDLQAPETAISTIREKIARRMRESLQSTAQYTLNTSADAGGLLLLRARLKASTGAPNININDMVMFCTVKALLDVPDLNVLFADGKLYRGREVHLGFACDTPKGLLVPVVRNAQDLSPAQLAARVKELSQQAVAGRISADDLTGGTFTVSNLGGFGIESFTPLLNPPQVAILGVDAIQLKPVRRDGKVEFIDSIGLSLTLDHQIVDGAPGARFLKVVREKIEAVEQICTI